MLISQFLHLFTLLLHIVVNDLSKMVVRMLVIIVILYVCVNV